jgi:hypothetical protein
VTTLLVLVWMGWTERADEKAEIDETLAHMSEIANGNALMLKVYCIM